MCVGQGTDQAAPGEVWLSPQNRNFKHRMGPDSVANLASAATVAASSFEMVITDPRSLLDDVDMDLFRKHLGYSFLEASPAQGVSDIIYHEPYGIDADELGNSNATTSSKTTAGSTLSSGHGAKFISGKALVLGDFIDTGAIIPSAFLHTSKTEQEFGSHCMQYSMPEFCAQVAQGNNIIIAGRSFGIGSSRDVVVTALKGAGVQCVIAKSFIYARNQPNLGLLGILITDERFHELARGGEGVEVDIDGREVRVAGERFGFQLSEMEKQLIAAGGMMGAFRRFGKRLFDVMCSGEDVVVSLGKGEAGGGGSVVDMENTGQRNMDETTLRY